MSPSNLAGQRRILFVLQSRWGCWKDPCQSGTSDKGDMHFLHGENRSTDIWSWNCIQLAVYGLTPLLLCWCLEQRRSDSGDKLFKTRYHLLTFSKTIGLFFWGAANMSDGDRFSNCHIFEAQPSWAQVAFYRDMLLFVFVARVVNFYGSHHLYDRLLFSFWVRNFFFFV